ncbi:MAG: riboflavin synthase [Armatimonadetes bacterium]|nr:riboflavin synthase [Armatimonadota bacterium]
MFTGIIREVGRISGIRPAPAGRALVVAGPATAATTSIGDSVAINGVCLTVTAVTERELEVFAGAETCARTTLGFIGVGAPVNIEPALRATDALGGHIVQGHVDGMARLLDATPQGETVRMRFSAPAELIADMVIRGSVAVDGVSLTITGLGPDWFSVAIIPFTWENTTLRTLSPGDLVNVETDIIAKYVRRFVEAQTRRPALTEQFLREHGYID